MATQASEQSGNHFIENVRPSLLRGGRLTKFKGQAVSLAPMFGGAAMVLMSSAAMIFSGSAAVAGSCAETTLGSGVWNCTGAANSGTDVTLSPTALAGGALSVTTSPGFGVDTSGTGGNAINLYTSTGDTNISFTDANAALIKSNNDGIVAINNGTGTTSITASGTVTGNSAGGNFGVDGIRVYNANTATDIAISAASSTGGRSGIFALNAGTGATSIAATAYVKGRTFDGIYARSFNAVSTGGITISAQKVTGGRYGIRADNPGYGVISVTATGAVTGGATTDGIALRGNTISTDFTVIATDVTGARFGIDARNTGIGATSVTTTGTVTGGSNDGITTRTNGTNITVNAGVVTGGRYGILARNFGTGTTSVTASGTVTGTGNDGIGIIAAASTTGATVSAVAVTGKDDGISVTNSGSGSTSITATGAVAGTGRGGIFAYNSATAAALTVDAAAVTGRAFGIYAKNKGTGATSVTTSGLVTGTNSTGIDARNSSSIGVGGLTINTAAVTGSLYGIRARNYGNGATGITASGLVAGGVAATGIDAINVNATSTSLTVSASAVSGGISGIKAKNSGSGAISITATGAVSGVNNEGIYANNASGTSLSIDAQGSVAGGSDGILATNNGTGALTVSLGGNVTGTTGQGLNAFNSANAGTSKMVINQALGTTTSGALNGILAINNATSGALTINASGTSVATGTFGGNGIHAANSGTDMSITANIATGITNGIFARNTGTGATSVSVTGFATGAGQSGIYAKGNGTSLSVSAVTVSGGTYGILARNSGTGSTSITATGAVSGASSGGIYVNTYNGSSAGDVTVAAQAVSGGGHGIYVNNAGYGATSITATGAVSGTGSSGIYTRSTGTNLGVTATAVSGAANGIFARNSGTGTTSVTATGTVSGTAGHGIYARGSGTDLTVSAAAVTGAKDGIRARNLGYGANSVTATGAVAGGATYNGILATNSGTGTDLTVSSAAVSGDMWGIHARNNGYGATSVSSTGLVSGNTYEGIYAINSGSGTSLAIDAQGDVVGGRNGIKARNLGKAGLTISAGGNVTATSGNGINAYNSANDVTASMVINQAAGTTTTGATGILANNFGGSLTVNALGTTNGTGGQGIQAINNTGTTNLTITANNVSGKLIGINANNSGTGATSITTTGAITGTNFGGIAVANKKPSGALTISTAAAVTGNLFGIGASSYSATGAINITSSGTVAGGNSGISASSYYTAVNITTTGAVTGTTGDGVFASGTSTGMTVNTGAVTGGAYGIHAINSHTNGALDMTINGAVTGGTRYGIYAETSGATSNATINLNAGAAVSATSGKAIYNGAGNSNITANAGASIAGSIRLGNGSDTLTFAGGDFSAITLFDGGDDASSADGFIDTLNFNGAGGALSGANILNWEKVSLGSGVAVSFVDNQLATGVLAIAAGGQLNTAASSFALTGNMANSGTVNMQNGSTGDAVTVSGDYTGGGALVLDVNTTLNTADTLAIAGNSSGTTLVTINNLTPLVSTGADITLVTVGGTSAASDFTLAGGAITAGAFDYNLSYQAGNFVLGKVLNSTGITYLAFPTVLGEVNRMQTLAQRVQGRQYSDNRAVWISLNGRKGQAGLTNGSTVDSRIQGIQLGADWNLEAGNTGQWVLGFTGRYDNLSSTVTTPLNGSGSTHSTGFGFGLSATWTGTTGTYIDAQAQMNWLSSDLSSSTSGALVTGLNTTATALSIEGGHRFTLGANTAIVPQAQISWGSTGSASFTDSVGSIVNLGASNSLVGRIGLAYEFARKGDAQKLYITGSALHDFSSGNTVNIAGVNATASLANSTSIEVGFGGTARLGASELYGEAGVRTGIGGGNDLSVGGAFGWRIAF